MTRSCLIVDDSKIVRKIVHKIMEAFQFEVFEAENGETALAFCRNSLPTLILLDWNMPKMDGYAFLQSLRALPQGAEPVVIFCTTETDVKKIEAGLAAGANEYIMKPFDGGIIESKLSQLGLL